MAYRVTIPIVLGSGQVGLTLTAKLYDTDNIQVGSDISTGFTEIGLGNYAWDYASIPADFRGWVKFYSGATLMAFTTIVPEDVELVDAIDERTANLPDDPADESLVIAAIGTRLAAADYVAPTNSDPLTSDVPGAYNPGTARYVIGQLAGVESVGSLAPVVTSSGDLELVKGQDYKGDNKIVFTNTGSWPDLNGAVVTLEAFGSEFDMEVVDYVPSTQSVSVEISVEDTADLPLNRYSFRVRAQIVQGVAESVILTTGRIIFTE